MTVYLVWAGHGSTRYRASSQVLVGFGTQRKRGAGWGVCVCTATDGAGGDRNRAVELESQLVDLMREAMAQVGEVRSCAKQETQRLAAQVDEALRDAREQSERSNEIFQQALALSEQLTDLRATTVPRGELLDAQTESDQLRCRLRECCSLAQARDEQIASLRAAMQVTPTSRPPSPTAISPRPAALVRPARLGFLPAPLQPAHARATAVCAGHGPDIRSGRRPLRGS